MAFKDDIPNYKQLKGDCLYLNNLPSSIWSQIEALAFKAAGGSGSILKEIIDDLNSMILIPPTNNWGIDWLKNDLSETIRALRKKADSGKFYLFMDAISKIFERSRSNLDVDEINELLVDNDIGYKMDYDDFYRESHWSLRENIDDLSIAIEEAKEAVKTTSQQAVEHLDQAKKQLENADNERARKDAVRDCASAMEAIIKELGGKNDIKEASKALRNEAKWGKDEIVKDGDAIFNTLHRLYPDLRHGSTETSTMTLNEARYWADRITTYINYMIREKDK